MPSPRLATMVGVAGLLVAVAIPVFGRSSAQSSVPAQQPVALGVINGTVTRAGSTEGLASVVVSVEVPAARMRALLDAAAAGATNIPAALLDAAKRTPAPGSGTNSAITVSVTTDSSGRFTVTVPNGAVEVSAQRADCYGPFVLYGAWSSSASETVYVSAQQPASVRFELIPGGTISGRAIDPGGRPMARVRIFALRRGYSWNGLPLLYWTAATQTDGQGAYRLTGVIPVEHYLLALQPPQRTSTGAPPGDIVSTYYSSAVDSASAVSLSVRSGEELKGIDIQTRAVPMFSIRGRITSTLPTGSEVSALNNATRQNIARIRLLPHDALIMPDGIASAEHLANADGTFVLRNVQNGRYDVTARLPVARGWGAANPPAKEIDPWAFGHATVDVRGGNVDGVSIVVHQGQDVRGRVLVDDKPAPAPLKIHLFSDEVFLRSQEDNQFVETLAGFSPEVGQDGAFVFPVVPEGRYPFNVGITGSLARGGYVADVLMNRVSVFDSGLTVANDPVGPLEVIVRTDAGAVEGTVRDADSKPVARAHVVLVPDGARRQNPLKYFRELSNRLGQFSMRRVPPGAYKLFAWDSVQVGQWANADFLQKYEHLAVPVTVSATAMTNADVRVMIAAGVTPPKVVTGKNREPGSK